MAVRTSTVRGGSGRISGSTSYSSVISRYASQILSAIQSETQAEINSAILAYKAGSMTWNDVKAFFEKRILTAEGADKVSLQQNLVDLGKLEQETQKNKKRVELEAKYAGGGITPEERYNIEKEILSYETPGTDAYVAQQDKVITAFDNAETQKVMQRRDQLLTKYADGGITPPEQLAINQELKSIANPDSKIYNQLVQEEQSIRQSLDTYNKGQGQTNLTNTSRDKLAEIITAEKQSDINYQMGVASGYDRDLARASNAKETYQILQSMADAGISIPIELITGAKENYMQSQNLLNLREKGLLMDVVDSAGVVTPMTVDGRDPITGKNVNYKNYPIDPDPTGTLFRLNTPDGKVQTFTSLKTAQVAAEKLGLGTFDVLLPNSQGGTEKKTLAQDPQSGAYYDATNPTIVYAKLPGSSADLTKVTMNLPANWRTDPNKISAVKELVNTYSTGLKPVVLDANGKPISGGILDYNNALNKVKGTEPTTETQTQTGGNFLQSMTDFLQGVTSPIKSTENTIKAVGAIPGMVKSVGQASAQLEPVVNKIANAPLNLASKAIEYGVKTNAANLGFPIDNFKLPEFKMPTPNFVSPGIPALSGINLPKMDFLGDVKKITTNVGNAVGGVVNSIGSGVKSLWGNTIGRWL